MCDCLCSIRDGCAARSGGYYRGRLNSRKGPKCSTVWYQCRDDPPDATSLMLDNVSSEPPTYSLEAILHRQFLSTSVKFSGGGVASKVLPATSMHSRL